MKLTQMETAPGHKKTFRHRKPSRLTADLLESVGGCFAVLLDSDEVLRMADQEVDTLLGRLLDARCIYFVCAGTRGEELHDRVDDEIVDRELEGILTTYHDGDTADEVASYFLDCASVDVSVLLVAVPDGNEIVRAVERALRIPRS